MDNYSLSLDLHGKNIKEAAALVQNSFFQFENDETLSILYIVTGKGTGAIKTYVEECLEKDLGNEYYSWLFDEHRSCFIVEKLF